MTKTICQSCGASSARRYRLIDFGDFGEPGDEREFMMCARCARNERKRLKALPDPNDGLTRVEIIAALDRFFASSGVFDICRRCHEQGTGCCPTTCRVMGANGCDPKSRHGKSVFCATFICGALLNAISECDAETGRALKWVKTELGSAEFRIYEMITRVPASEREAVSPIALPRRYPWLNALGDGGKIKKKLAELSSEVLEIRWRWHELERLESSRRESPERRLKTDRKVAERRSETREDERFGVDPHKPQPDITAFKAMK